MVIKLLSTSIIASIVLIGCGGETSEKVAQDISMPHQVDLNLKNSREFDPEGDEYLDFMKTYYLNSTIYDVTITPNTRGPYPTWIKLKDYENRNQDLKYVFYLDYDYDETTGYYDKWVPNAGADYLVEDGILYKYTGTAQSNEWSWEFVNQYAGSVHKKDGIHLGLRTNDLRKTITYGVTLNQDWTYNSFLGYFDTSWRRKNKETKLTFNEQTNREFTTAKDEDNVYLHSYKKNYQKTDENEIYFNYRFSINDINYETQGNILLNNEGVILADNLRYEVREYDIITIIPKNLINGDMKVNSVSVRDDNWNELYSLSAI